MALTSPGFKKMEGTVVDVSGGGAAPPTADAGPDQAQDHLAVVTLDGSGSTAGVTYAWTLLDPLQTDKTSILSSATAESPTFQPTDWPIGSWTATLIVTKDGVSAQDNCTIRIGDANGWLRFSPGSATSTTTSAAYATQTWTDDGTWTSVLLSDKVGTANKASNALATKWRLCDIGNSMGSLSSIEVRIQISPTSTHTLAEALIVGFAFGTTTTFGASWDGFTFLFRDVEKTVNTSVSCRKEDSTFSWQDSSSGYDCVIGGANARPYAGHIRRMTWTKVLTVSPWTNNTDTTSSFPPLVDGSVYDSPLYIGMCAGRLGTTVGDLTIVAKCQYRINKRGF